jgi:hypothetical protein
LHRTVDGARMTMKILLRDDCMTDIRNARLAARAASRMSASHLLLRRMKLGVKSGYGVANTIPARSADTVALAVDGDP